MSGVALCLRLLPLLSCALLAACNEAPPPAKRMQTVKLLPDTPPPPPRPEEKKPEPPKQDRPQPQAPQVKPAEAPPVPQALKSDEAAGDGPGSGLVAGSVASDYSGQPIGSGTTVGGSGDDAAARLAANAFANATTRALNEYLAREKTLRRNDYRARVLLWLAPGGAVQRVELAEGTGDAETDQTLRAAIARFPGAATPPPEKLPQPLRLVVTNRMMG